eukprot:5210748-Amphidinium_carterae.2
MREQICCLLRVASEFGNTDSHIWIVSGPGVMRARPSAEQDVLVEVPEIALNGLAPKPIHLSEKPSTPEKY